MGWGVRITDMIWTHIWTHIYLFFPSGLTDAIIDSKDTEGYHCEKLFTRLETCKRIYVSK